MRAGREESPVLRGVSCAAQSNTPIPCDAVWSQHGRERVAFLVAPSSCGSTWTSANARTQFVTPFLLDIHWRFGHLWMDQPGRSSRQISAGIITLNRSVWDAKTAHDPGLLLDGRVRAAR